MATVAFSVAVVLVSVLLVVVERPEDREIRHLNITVIFEGLHYISLAAPGRERREAVVGEDEHGDVLKQIV